MKHFLSGVVVTLLTVGAVGAGLVYGGLVDMSADTPHSALVYRVIETAREKSIERAIRNSLAPANLSDPERVRRGSGNYAAMCVECHLAPGKANSEIRKGLYPEPPDLSRPTKTEADAAARQFWIIKHGIKASGMPAWSKGGIEDEAIWDMVAFLQTMPTMTADQYAALVASSDGHSHGGLESDSHPHGEAGPTESPNGHETPAQELGKQAVPAAVKKKAHDPNDGHSH